MVGVPRSEGCGTCIKRRVKCDQERPACRRCRDRNIECAGYQRRLRFYHQTPASISGRKRKETGLPRAKDQDIRAVALATRVITARAGMDNLLAPSLASAAADLQMKEVFHSFIMACFPGLFCAWRNRVQLNWLDFVRHHLDTSSHALIWSIRSLSTWHLGQSQQNQDVILSSRHMYGRGLRHLIQSLRDPRRATSNWTLMAAIHLGIYEMLHGLGDKSWLVHSRGIAKLFHLRGPDAHRDGFGRTLLVAYRAFLVADAFVCQEPCFLAEHGWRSVMHEFVAAERRDGKSSRLGETIEFAFNEIVLCPGLFVQTRDLVAARDASEILQESLVAQITRSRDRLCDLEGQMGPLLGEQKGMIEQRDDLMGLIPAEVVSKVAQLSYQGIRSAIAMLNQLLIVLEAARGRTALDSSSNSIDCPWKLSIEAEPLIGIQIQRPIPEGHEGDSQDQLDQLDQLALSMGMMRT
ncbi:Zn(II)2Cys6 transcription factor [Aspergillus clavatus NRRL 1]|uniref:C6 finger domain protein, putative n=1 Tax=Aspergillus clavatus (strain ATCC 1007 / CBS 513.65 / DSM 816 / NCTC 3887 / NRRL 1 / QM 1276 / 107) TaxID=344612 RepID=A1C8L9_ASPCL|nr:C6 finger domain protein, putative [Aspergillus clavatus NRRL 1]EAW13656.1 C6 finger domain protein, putative [Aspergillus clavatus NRRL 1]